MRPERFAALAWLLGAAVFAAGPLHVAAAQKQGEPKVAGVTPVPKEPEANGTGAAGSSLQNGTTATPGAEKGVEPGDKVALPGNQTLPTGGKGGNPISTPSDPAGGIPTNGSAAGAGEPDSEEEEGGGASWYVMVFVGLGAAVYGVKEGFSWLTSPRAIQPPLLADVELTEGDPVDANEPRSGGNPNDPTGGASGGRFGFEARQLVNQPRSGHGGGFQQF